MNEVTKDFVACGTDTYSISKIERIVVKKATIDELEAIEHQKNGEFFPMECPANMQKILDKYCFEIGSGLPEPTITKADVPLYARDSNPANWLFQKKGNHQFYVENASAFNFLVGKSNSACLEEAFTIRWVFEIKYNSENGVKEKTERQCCLCDIMAVLKKLINAPKPKSKVGGFFKQLESGGHSYEEIQKDLPAVYKEYLNLKKKIDKRNKEKEEFLAANDGKSILYVFLNNERAPKKYLESYCGFDIFEKKNEILTCLQEAQDYQNKLKNSNNAGEKNVEHALKWFMVAHDDFIMSIENDCESQYRYNCILLSKPEVIDEPQEYDHILVCSAGVILIETKHWKGKIEIRSDGKWLRKADDEASVIGVESPKIQLRRHEILMQKILPNVPVFSVLCFSNASVIIDGREHFKDYPIVMVDQLEEFLMDLCAKGNYSKKDIEWMKNEINAHKIKKCKGI